MYVCMYLKQLIKFDEDNDENDDDNDDDEYMETN